VEDQSSLLQGTMQEDSFEVVMRGYNKRQVDDYVLQCQHHIRDLAQRLALSEQEIARVRADAAMAIEKASAKPVHEEVSERLAQILRLANEEAERERASAAEEIGALRAEALAEINTRRDQAQQEAEAMCSQAVAEAEARRAQAQAETEALRQRTEAETDAMREVAERETVQMRAEAAAAPDRVLGEAQAAAEDEIARARAEVQGLEETARSESERLVLTAQQRADRLIGEAEYRANAVNTVLGGRLEILTSTHADVVRRLMDLGSVLADVLGREKQAGPFEVPPVPAESTAANGPYMQTADEVATAYEAARSAQTPQPPIPPAPTVSSPSSSLQNVTTREPDGWPSVPPAQDPAGGTKQEQAMTDRSFTTSDPSTGPMVVTLDDERAVSPGHQ
jgi:hypothetical protein